MTLNPLRKSGFFVARKFDWRLEIGVDTVWPDALVFANWQSENTIMKKLYSPATLASDLKALDDEMAKLKARREEIMKEVQLQADIEWKTLLVEFEWQVDWESPRVMRVNCRPSPAMRQARQDWKAKFPGMKPSGVFSMREDDSKWHGMSYYLIGNTIIPTGGGSVILALRDTWANKEPQDLTQEQADAFRAGRVPEELKKGW